MTGNLQSALEYAAKGWAVFPVSQHKAPLTSSGFKAATTDPGKITEWWTKYPKAGIGAATGEVSGFWVLDVDGDEGAMRLEELQEEHGEFPDTAVAKTCSGGVHYFFRGGSGQSVKSRAGVLPQVDTRGNGGYVVLAPSECISKHDGRPHPYAWHKDLDIAPAPDWLVSMVNRNHDATRHDDGWPKDPLAYAKAALIKGCQELEAMPPGTGRNSHINRLAFVLSPFVKGGWLDEGEFRDTILESAEIAGHDRDRARKAIDSGYRAGREPQTYASAEPVRGDDEKVGHIIILAKTGLEAARGWLRRERLVQYGGLIWRFRQGKWKAISASALEREAFELWDNVYKETEDGLESVFATSKLVDELKRALYAVAPAGDPIPGLVSVENGVLNMGNGELTAAIPEQFVPISVKVAWDQRAAEKPEKAQSRWFRFMDEVFDGDQGRQMLLAEWLGYLLSGRTSYHKFMFLVGRPRSGKSLIGRVVAELVGRDNFVGIGMPDLAARFGMQNVLGKPIAWIGDSKSHHWRNPAVLSAILSVVGEDHQQIDRKFKTPFHGRVPARLTFTSNELPEVSDDSKAIYERALILPFRRSFAGREDWGLEKKIIETSLESVLLTAVGGYRNLIANRGRFSFSEVTPERELFGETPIREFLDEACVLDPKSSTKVQDVYRAWVSYAERSGIKPRSKIAMVRAILQAEPKIGRRRSGSGRYLDGIRVPFETL